MSLVFIGDCFEMLVLVSFNRPFLGKVSSVNDYLVTFLPFTCPDLLQFASFLTFLPADHDTLDDYGTALTHGILPGIPF